MLSNDTQPAAIPGVVDGFLTVCPVAGHEVSFHIVLGPGPHPARIEFILSPDHAAAIREALDESTPAPLPGAGSRSVPCRIGIHIIR